jgi:large conductance mechanosensitive channel
VIKEFKEFILRGSVVDLAIGVAIGAAFTAIVTSLVQDIFTPLLGVLDIPDFSTYTAKVGPASLAYGKFVQAVVSFLLIATVLFFLVVKPVNHLMGRAKKDESPKMRECPHCLTSIRVEATACPACTREVATV